jgi:hypothetical protein
MNAFQLVQTFFWLAISTWFGGILFVALAAPIIMRVLQDANPLLPEVLSVNLDKQHSSLLAGEIVGNILKKMVGIQLGCVIVLLLTLLLQWLVMDLSTPNKIHAIIRATLFAGAAGLFIYDRWYIWPKVWKFRQEYIDHADEPEVANPAKDQFDRYHSESVKVLFIQLVLISLMIVFSTVITPRPV